MEDAAGGDRKSNGKRRDEEPDGMSVHSPCKAPPSSASSLPKEQSQVELELRLLEALAIYPPVKLRGKALSYPFFPIVWDAFGSAGMHRHFVLYGLMEFLRRRFFDRYFSPDEVMQLLERFYNIEMLKPDDEEAEMLSQEEDFSLPQSYFVKEE
ncbi:unnamed protein product [Linum tenue]|uniref:Uncharacterized protein n=1 Tax=Linum tenue TaxID=586396 RepID=A0AAV0HZN9_9ROSI|nr:unnamed protein product [Linum tenue]